MKLRTLLTTLTIATAVAGCTTWDLQKLRKTEPQGDAFQRALAKQYLAFSESEAKIYDWSDSQYFARKGLTVAYGKDAEPEEAGSWNITGPARQELTEAREKLMGILPSGRSGQPEVAANAQFNYDCWVENQAEGWESDEIEACRAKFFDALNTLSGSKSAPVVTQKTPSPQVQNAGYTIYFNLSSSKLDKEGNKVIAQVLKDITGLQEYEVIINGHTDRAGSAVYNLELGMKRAEVVRGELVRGGVSEKKISVFSFGETDPKVKTGDGAKELKNRRVEIFISE